VLAVLAGLRDDIGRRLPSGFSCVPPSLWSEDGSNPRLDGLLYEVKPARENKEGGASASPFSFMRLRGRARSLPGMRGYFWMQVSAVSLVHSSRPVNTGSSTFLPSIRSIMTDGAL